MESLAVCTADPKNLQPLAQEQGLNLHKLQRSSKERILLPVEEQKKQHFVNRGVLGANPIQVRASRG